MRLSALSILLPIFVGAIFYKQLTKAFKILYGFILITGAMEAWAMILSFLQMNNIALFHFFTFFQFILLSTVFYLMCPVKPYRHVVLVVSVLFSLYFLFNLVTMDLTVFHTSLKTSETVILLTYSIGYLMLALSRSDLPYLEMNPYFVLVAGLFLYFLGTLIVFIFSFQLKEIETFLPTWTIHNLLNIFLNLIYFSVLWRSRKE